jgi:hypothetical protein
MRKKYDKKTFNCKSLRSRIAFYESLIKEGKIGASISSSAYRRLLDLKARKLTLELAKNTGLNVEVESKFKMEETNV